MRSIIYYFSATGNSLKVAKDLAEQLGDTTLVSIPKVMDTELDLSADNIGIVYPVYCWGMPLMAAKFIKKLRKGQSKYFFAIATCGGSGAGALLQTKNVLAQQKIELSAGFMIQMPTNYIVWSGAIPEERQQKMFDNWKQRLNGIVAIIKSQKKSEIESGSFFANVFLSKMLYHISMPNLSKMAKSFWVNDSCNQCSICKNICPAGNIEMKDGRPTWNQKCEQCLACIQWCPKQAIQFGKNTQDRKRYNNPAISIKEML